MASVAIEILLSIVGVGGVVFLATQPIRNRFKRELQRLGGKRDAAAGLCFGEHPRLRLRSQFPFGTVVVANDGIVIQQSWRQVVVLFEDLLGVSVESGGVVAATDTPLADLLRERGPSVTRAYVDEQLSLRITFADDSGAMCSLCFLMKAEDAIRMAESIRQAWHEHKEGVRSSSERRA